MILLPPFPKCKDYMCAPSLQWLRMEPTTLRMLGYILSYLPIPRYLYNVIIGQKDGMLFHTVSRKACWTCLSSPPWRDMQLSYHHGEAAQTRMAFLDPRLPWNPRSPPMLHQPHANTCAVLWKQPWKSSTGCVGTMRSHLAGLVLSVTWETQTV